VVLSEGFLWMRAGSSYATSYYIYIRIVSKYSIKEVNKWQWVSILGHLAGDNLSLLGWIGYSCMLSTILVEEMRLSRIVDSTLLRYLASMSNRLIKKYIPE
jgi:hypothetical protein